MAQPHGYDIDICFDIALDRNMGDVRLLSHEEKELARKLAHQRINDPSFDRGNVRRPAMTGARALITLMKALDKLGVLDGKTEAQLDKIKARLDVEGLADQLAMSYLLETTGGWPGWGMGTWGYDWKKEYARRLKECRATRK